MGESLIKQCSLKQCNIRVGGGAEMIVTCGILIFMVLLMKQRN